MFLSPWDHSSGRIFAGLQTLRSARLISQPGLGAGASAVSPLDTIGDFCPVFPYEVRWLSLLLDTVMGNRCAAAPSGSWGGWRHVRPLQCPSHPAPDLMPEQVLINVYLSGCHMQTPRPGPGRARTNCSHRRRGLGSCSIPSFTLHLTVIAALCQPPQSPGRSLAHTRHLTMLDCVTGEGVGRRADQQRD